MLLTYYDEKLHEKTMRKEIAEDYEKIIADKDAEIADMSAEIARLHALLDDSGLNNKS